MSDIYIEFMVRKTYYRVKIEHCNLLYGSDEHFWNINTGIKQY